MPPTSVIDVQPKEEELSFCQKTINSCFGKSQSNIYEVPGSYPDHVPITHVIKILVVGPGDSGKSTIMKQMKVIHGKNYTTEECKKFKPIIIQNILDSIIRLVDAMRLFSLEFDNESNNLHFESIKTCFEHVKCGDLNDWDIQSTNYCENIRSIWNDSSIKICFERRNLFYLNDSTAFFMSNLNRICSKQYIPELDDILRVRQPTTAVKEYTFQISDTYFLFVDVGGQRSERRKWINCFENITSLLFVASLSDYDLKLSRDELKTSNSNENEEVNRMQDALDLFRTLINWKKKTYTQPKNSDERPKEKETLLFDKVSIILFLNKEDLFEEKFKRSSLKSCFKDYVDTDSVDKAKEFVRKKFVDCVETKAVRNKRDIYWHYTFALDRKCIETVVASVRDQILRYMLDAINL